MNNQLRCRECGEVIFSWEEAYRWHDGGWVCGECFDGIVGGLDRMEIAQLMRCEVVMGEELER